MGQCLKKSRSEPKKTEVNDWLAENGLGEYSAKFKERGWDEVSLLLEMSDIQIESCIQKPGHVVKFKRALGRLDPNVDELNDMDLSYSTESRPKTNRQNSNFHRTGSGHSAQRNRRRASHSSHSDSEPMPQNVNFNRMGSGSGNRRRVSYSSDSDSGFKPTPAKQNAKPIKTLDAQVHHQRRGSNSSDVGSIENEHVTVTRIKKLGMPVDETKSISSADDDSHDDEKNLEPTDRGVTYQVEGTANVKLQRYSYISHCKTLILGFWRYWRLLGFGDIGGLGKELYNISPPILHRFNTKTCAQHNGGSDKKQYLMSILDLYIILLNYKLWHPIRIASMRRF